MRPIDADGLKELLKEYQSECLKNPNEITEALYGGLGAIIDVIDQQPTVEPVKRGKWINSYGDTPYDARDKNNWWHCSECKHPVTTMFKSPWCPECGAKMDGDD